MRSILLNYLLKNIKCLGGLGILFSCFAATTVAAQGDLLITPKRVVFEGKTRMQELSLANIGTDTVKFMVSFMVCVMLMAPCFVLPVFGKKEEPGYEETSVLFQVPGVGETEIPALVNGQKVYLSVTAIFDYLKIKNTLAAGSDAVSGFLITEDATYLIDKVHNSIHYQGKIFPLQEDDLVRSTTNLYMNPEIFSRVFGLICKFTFRTLTVNMSTRLELPVIREMRQELMRRNVNRVKGQVKADAVTAEGAC